MDDSLRLKTPEHVLHQNLQGETILLDLNSDTYFGLDEVGTRFWELVGVDGRVAAAVDSILQEYEVERAELEADVGNLIEELVEKGLLEVNEPIE